MATERDAEAITVAAALDVPMTDARDAVAVYHAVKDALDRAGSDTTGNVAKPVVSKRDIGPFPNSATPADE